MKTLMTSTALSLLLVGGAAVAQSADPMEPLPNVPADEESSGRDALPEIVEDDLGTDVSGPDAATADEGTLGGGRGTVATAPTGSQDDPGKTTRFIEDYYDLGYRERDGYIWEDGEFLLDEDGERVAVDRADEFERDADGRFAMSDDGRMMRREELAAVPRGNDDAGRTTQFIEDYYDLGYEERDGMLFEDGRQMTDRQDRPITTDTYSFYEQDDQGRLMTDDKGEFRLRDDAPEFSVNESGEMEMGES
jgi:hypothetical protein